MKKIKDGILKFIKKLKDERYTIFIIFFTFGGFIISDNFLIKYVVENYPNVIIFSTIPLLSIFLFLGAFILWAYQFSPNKFNKFFIEKFSFKRNKSNYLFYISFLSPFTAGIVIILNFRKRILVLILYSLIYAVFYYLLVKIGGMFIDVVYNQISYIYNQIIFYINKFL